MGAVTETSAARRSFWRAPNYAAWFTADTASAAGGALRALAVSLAGYAVSGSTAAAGWLGTAALIAQQCRACSAARASTAMSAAR